VIQIEYLKAIKRPFTDFNKFLIGVALLLIPIVNILTGFIVKGFHLECAKDTKKKKYALPNWKNFKKLFIIGVLSFLISLIYLIPALVILFISVGSFVLEIIQSTELNLELLTASLSSAETTGFAIGLFLAILTGYLIPIALMEFLNKYKFKNAFKINLILKKAFKAKYLGVVLVILLYYLAVYLIFSLLMTLFAFIPSEITIKVISAILSSIVSFVIGVTAFTLIGEVYPNLK